MSRPRVRDAICVCVLALTVSAGCSPEPGTQVVLADGVAIQCGNDSINVEELLRRSVVTLVSASDCLSCNQHTLGIDSAAARLGDQISFFTVAFASGAEALALQRSHGGVPARRFCTDPQGAIAAAFGIDRTPATLVLSEGAVEHIEMQELRTEGSVDLLNVIISRLLQRTASATGLSSD